MKKSLAVFAMLLMSLSVAESRQQLFPRPLSPRIANYSIAVKLDARRKMLSGKETLVWRNSSRNRIRELQFHLYLNGFKNTESTFMKESGGAHRGIEIGEEWGWIEIDTMIARGREDLTSKIEFISPDDGNTKDQTVIRVPLKRALGLNESITIDLSFRAKLPKVVARTGYDGNFFMVGQWFPKIGVYETPGMRGAVRGGWNCHQFHSNTEFYADYGVYDVQITVPESFTVGATGVRRGQRSNPDSTITEIYHAEDVHDFAWTASPRFQVLEDQWQHVAIRLLIQPEHLADADRYFHSAEAALQYFNDWLGRYPYPNLTIVDPPAKAFGAAGMEYPTLITGGSFWGVPDGIRFTALATVHEFGHQYWYGLVANNEFEEAWLDEGLNQYSEGRIMDETYGEKTSVIELHGFQMGDLEFSRSGYTGMSNPKIAPTFLKAWEYRAGGYGSLTYNKTATFMTTLERIIGRPVMGEIMKTYFEQWRFKHPSTGDFIAVVNEVVRKRHGKRFGNTMNWFFDQVLYGTDVCDYELTGIQVEAVEKPRGVFAEGKKDTTQETDKSDSRYKSKLLVNRLGEVRMPVEVLIHFSDSTEIRERWDGQGRWKTFEYERAAKATWAKVDPDETLLIDVNLINNSKTTETKTASTWKYTAKFMFWVENILQWTTLF